MLIRVDTSTGTPIWQQIVSQVTRQVMSGNIAAGERLPTVRELAADLRINPNTAARAYQDLERDGVVETRRGAGTFVCNVVSDKRPAELKTIIEERFTGVIVEALHFNFSRRELQTIFEARLAALLPEERSVVNGIGAYVNEGSE